MQFWLVHHHGAIWHTRLELCLVSMSVRHAHVIVALLHLHYINRVNVTTFGERSNAGLSSRASQREASGQGRVMGQNKQGWVGLWVTSCIRCHVIEQGQASSQATRSFAVGGNPCRTSERREHEHRCHAVRLLCARVESSPSANQRRWQGTLIHAWHSPGGLTRGYGLVQAHERVRTSTTGSGKTCVD